MRIIFYSDPFDDKYLLLILNASLLHIVGLHVD
jgi:hypothetical protein